MSPDLIDTVDFDIGGVLIDWDRLHLYRKLFASQAEMELFLRDVCSLDWHMQHDRARPTADTTRELIRDHPQYAEQIDAYRTRFSEMWSCSIDSSVEVLGDLQRRGFRTYAATNWSKEFWPLAIEHFPFLARFDGALVSGEIGVCKPSIEFYLRLIEEFEVEPRRTLYIDDSKENIAAAARFGFSVIHVAFSTDLRSAISELGLI